jgi:hypothetical protein
VQPEGRLPGSVSAGLRTPRRCYSAARRECWVARGHGHGHGSGPAACGRSRRAGLTACRSTFLRYPGLPPRRGVDAAGPLSAAAPYARSAGPNMPRSARPLLPPAPGDCFKVNVAGRRWFVKPTAFCHPNGSLSTLLHRDSRLVRVREGAACRRPGIYLCISLLLPLCAHHPCRANPAAMAAPVSALHAKAAASHAAALRPARSPLTSGAAARRRWPSR